MVVSSAAPVRSAISPPWGSGGAAPFSAARVTSTDIEEQATNLDGWNQVYEQMTPGPFIGNLHELHFAGVQLFRETSNQAVHESGTPWTGSRAIGVPVNMEGAGLFRGHAVDAESVVTLGPDEELDFYAPRGLDILGLAIDADVLQAHAVQVEHRDIAPVFGSASVFKPGMVRLGEFRRALLSVLNALDANPAALQFRQAQRVLERYMLAAVVAVINEDSARTDLPHPRRRHIVDSAKEFMVARISETVTVADLCIALGVSRRTLQYSFQEVLGINPVRFLRAMRLNGVRRSLKSAGDRAAAVQDVAANWGFWHLGHFVTEYKQMFGELPSETLRRARRLSTGAKVCGSGNLLTTPL
jgi:AraC family transcriptional regulator, ethanolamine operon transcriptional activator